MASEAQRIDQMIRAAVESAPPLSDEAASRLANLLPPVAATADKATPRDLKPAA